MNKTQIFIDKARTIHGEVYDYSKVDFVNSLSKIIIICKIHGEFTQLPSNHLKCQRCPKCFGNVKKTTEEFIIEASKIHEDKYDYSKVQYKNTETKVIIICKIHGDFLQTPSSHLNKNGCLICCVCFKKTTNEFINKSKTIHGERYDYSKVEYVNNHTKVIISCEIHGDFSQRPKDHWKGNACPKCCSCCKKTTNEFINDAMKIHGEKYDYSKVQYKNIDTKVVIICKVHGEFLQTPSIHCLGSGCSKCKNVYKYNTNEWIEKAESKHGDKYDYSMVQFTKAKDKVIIVCKTHGQFLQTPNNHLSGYGCPKCYKRHSKISILWLEFLSKFYNIQIQHAENDGEFKIPNTNYRADGFCPETNTVYEFHGDYWHGNLKIFKSDEFNKTTKCNFGKLYENTMKKENLIKKQGFILKTIWESEWYKLNNGIRKLQLKYRNFT